eukprot:12638991-Ditylum_brightwellii.AAC.1
MDELKLDCIPSGGAGNKMLMLLEVRSTAYIQDLAVKVLMWMEREKLQYECGLIHAHVRVRCSFWCAPADVPVTMYEMA